MQLPEPVYKPAVERVLHAMDLAGDLSMRTQLWWAQRPVRVFARIGVRSSDIEIVAQTNPLPPLSDWWRRAADVFSNLRSALDQFHHEVWMHVRGTEPGHSVYFPITADEVAWENWERQHKRFPAELISRYRAFQPWVSGRPYLRDLAEIKRAENHRRSLVPGLDLAKMDIGGISMTVTPTLTKKELQECLTAAMADSTALDRHERVLLTMSLPGHLELIDDDPPLEYEFSPYFVAGGEQVPWTAGLSLISREVTWAIAHISGFESQAVNPPSIFTFN